MQWTLSDCEFLKLSVSVDPGNSHTFEKTVQSMGQEGRFQHIQRINIGSVGMETTRTLVELCPFIEELDM